MDDELTIPSRPRELIPNSIAYSMVTVALFFDLLQFVPKIFFLIANAGTLAIGWIPYVGQVGAVGLQGVALLLDYIFCIAIALCGFMTIWLWFKLRGVSLGFWDRMLGKRALRMFLTWGFLMLMECLPIFNIVPSLTIGTIATVLMVKGDYKEACRAWEGKVSQLEAFAWQIVKMDIRDARRVTSFLHAAKKGELSRGRVEHEVQFMRRQAAIIRQNALRERSVYQRRTGTVSPSYETT